MAFPAAASKANSTLSDSPNPGALGCMVTAFWSSSCDCNVSLSECWQERGISRMAHAVHVGWGAVQHVCMNRTNGLCRLSCQ